MNFIVHTQHTGQTLWLNNCFGRLISEAGVFFKFFVGMIKKASFFVFNLGRHWVGWMNGRVD